MNVIEMLDAAGIHHEPKEEDHTYIECWKCGKDNLSINTFTGAWHCWSLGCEDIKGGFHKLARELDIDSQEFTPLKAPTKIRILTDEDRERISNSQNNKSEVIEWAVSRSLDPDFVLKQGVGYDPEKKAIIIPYKDEKGTLIGARCRSTFYDTQWTIGREPDLFIIDPADLNSEKLIIVEGEPDAFTIKQMGLPCIAILGSRKDNGYQMLRRPRQIYIGYDMDGAGEAGAEKAASLLGRYRCKRTHWTQKDPNDMLKAGATKEDFLECLKASTSMVTDLKSLSAKDAIKEYLHEKKLTGNKRRSWGYPRMDKFTHGIKPGWCMYMMARGNAGKTTFLLNVMMNQVESGIPCGCASFEEENASEIMPKLIAMVVGRNPGRGEFDPRELEAAEETLDKIKLYTGKRDVNEFCEWVREIYYVHNVRFIVADYLQLLARGNTPEDLLDALMMTGKDLCKELPGLNILWAVQPKQLLKQLDRKTGDKQIAKIDGSDARGGSVIEQACDVMLVMSMVDSVTTQYEFSKVRGQLQVTKRDWLGQITQLEYDHATLRLRELEHMNYGNNN